MSVELERVGWEDGTLVTPARVTTPTGTYDVTDATYSGETPLSAENLKKMENNTERAINNLNQNEYTEDDSKGYSANYVNSKVKPISLYHNDSGTRNNITFTQTIPTNYNYIDVIFTGNNNTTDVTRIYDISKRANLVTANTNNTATNAWMQMETIVVTSTGITRGTQAEIGFSQGVIPYPNASTILIKDVFLFL